MGLNMDSGAVAVAPQPNQWWRRRQAYTAVGCRLWWIADETQNNTRGGREGWGLGGRRARRL